MRALLWMGMSLLFAPAWAAHEAAPPGGYKGCGNGNGQCVAIVHGFALVSCTHGGGYTFDKPFRLTVTCKAKTPDVNWEATITLIADPAVEPIGTRDTHHENYDSNCLDRRQFAGFCH